MKFTAEFRRRGEYGTMIAIKDNLDDLFDTIVSRGWSDNGVDRFRAASWGKDAKSGAKYYGVRNDLTIIKGDSLMSDYTSF